MSETKCVDILIKILETLRDDEILLNKMSETSPKEDLQQQIDDIIAELKDIETSETNVIELRTYIEDISVEQYIIYKMIFDSINF